MEEGEVRTDLYCHDCGKNFIAVLDFSLDGNHEIECPSCGHLHYRKIKGGKVTDDRFDSDGRTHKVSKRSVWKCDSKPIITSTASTFMRDLWLNRSDLNLD